MNQNKFLGRISKYFIRNFDFILILLFILSISIIYAFISVASHDHFQTFGWDLGFFDQIIWKVSRGIFPFSTISKVNLFAGHFSPILILFAPLYWIWSDPGILLITQSFLVISAAIPLYFLAKSKTGSFLFSASAVLSYVFFMGTQWTILNEFHEMAVVPLLLAVIFYSLEKKRNILYFIALFLLLLTKEEMALLVSSIGLTSYFYFGRKKGIALFIFGIILFFFLTLFFMPRISEEGVYYQSSLSSSAKTPSEFTIKVISDPFFMMKSLITPPGKIKVLIESLLSFGILPIFAPLVILIPLAEQFFMRFIYTGPQFTFWQNVNHHAAPAAILLAVSSIYGAVRFGNIFHINKKKYWLICSLVLFFSSVSQDIIFKAPIHSIFKKQLYETQSWMKDNYDIISQIPGGVPVAAQNSMVPHLSQREKIYLLPEISDAEYIAVDLHDGPNKYSPFNYAEMKQLTDDLLLNKEFIIKDKKGEAILLYRNKAH